jgi:hypothetical protein
MKLETLAEFGRALLVIAAEAHNEGEISHAVATH